jgi:hypothetical protein
MSVPSSDATDISIARYVEKIDEDYGTNRNIPEAITRNGIKLADTQ